MADPRRIRIALHNASREWGGAEISQTELLEGLSRRGHHAVMYYNHEVVAEGAAARGIEVRKSYLGGDAAVHHAWRLARALRRDKTDALILGFYKKNLLAALAGRLAGLPRVIARIDVSRNVPHYFKYRYVFKNWIDIVVTVSEDVRRHYIDAGDDPARVVTIHKGIEPGYLSKPSGAVRRSLGLAPDAPLIGAIGRLVTQKRFDRLLRAFAQLPEQVHCLIAGDGEQREALETLATELGVGERLHLLGWRTDIPDVVDALDVLVISSDFESLAIVNLEAMAGGVPVVSTAVAGAEEALGAEDDEVAPGVIVDMNADALAEVGAQLLADPEKRRAMGRAGKRRLKEKFSFQRMVDRWEEVLAGVR